MIEYLETELRPSPVLVVAFTGIRDLLGGIPFEFGRTMGQVPCATLFVRDIDHRWYQYGSDDSNAPDAVVHRIRSTAAKVGANRLVCLGNSMGGFGALMFGSLLQADAVMAFAPQTAIRPALTDSIGDKRWCRYQADIADYPHGDIALLPQPPEVTICYGLENALDIAHVDRLTWTFRRIATPAGHGAVRRLKESGELVPLIASMIGGQAR